MSLETLKQSIPDYAKDLRMNLGAVLESENLTGEQIWGTALACAIAARDETLTRTMLTEAKNKIADTVVEAAKIAAAMMAMNNIYYRSIHLMANDEYGKMPAKLRMNAIKTHNADPKDFELMSLAVSAINGCGLCLDSHEKKLKNEGVSAAAIQDALRIAAVIHAVAATLDAERVLKTPAAQAA